MRLSVGNLCVNVFLFSLNINFKQVRSIGFVHFIDKLVVIFIM